MAVQIKLMGGGWWDEGFRKAQKETSVVLSGGVGREHQVSRFGF
jgi:hypothetical protein